MKSLKLCLLLLSSLLLTNAACADDRMKSLMSDDIDDNIVKTTTKSIQIPLSDRPASKVLRPSKSMSQTRVIKDFGQPIKKYPPKGKPPITRWDYSEFSVYFESSSVIHSVVRSNE